VITTQLATKFLDSAGYPTTFDSGSRAVLVPLLGKSVLYTGMGGSTDMAHRKQSSPTTPDVSCAYNPRDKDIGV
jgi:hypothetical protein